MQISFSASGGPDYVKGQIKSQAESQKAQPGPTPEGSTCIDAIADALCNYVESVDAPSISVSVSGSISHWKNS